MAKTNANKKKGASARVTGAAVRGIVEDEFGNYKIRAGQLNGVFLARAFPRHSERSQGLVAEATGKSENDAIASLKSLLTKREEERATARRWEERSQSSVPTREEFFEALFQTNLSTAQQSILKAHALSGEDGLVAVSIMNAGGYKSQDAAIKALAKTGVLMADFIGLELPNSNIDLPEPAIRVLGYRKPMENDVPFHLVMHEELRDAVWRTISNVKAQ
ncbi:MAG: hypothetical protein AAFV87_10885 [Pseudomonadota bacterium]